MNKLETTGQAASSRTATLDRGGSQAKLMPQTVALMHLVFSERETRHSHPAQENPLVHSELNWKLWAYKLAR